MFAVTEGAFKLSPIRDFAQKNLREDFFPLFAGEEVDAGCIGAFCVKQGREVVDVHGELQNEEMLE